MTTPQSHEALIAERIQAAWDGIDTLPPITFSEEEVRLLAEALSRPTVAREIAQPDYDKLGLGDPEGRN